MASSPMTSGAAMTGHEASSLAFELVLLPSSISEKLLDPFKSNAKHRVTRLKEIPQPVLGVLTEFLQQLQIDNKMDTTTVTKDQRRKASVQLMVNICHWLRSA